MTKAGRLALVVALALIALLPSLANADALDDGVRRVGLQLQCPVCEGQTVADSNSGLAKDMRALIRTRLAAGTPDHQILDEFVASYGDSILTEPPKRGVSLGVWIGPVVGVVFGVALLTALLLTWRKPNNQASGQEPAKVSGEVAAEFRRFRNELGR